MNILITSAGRRVSLVNAFKNELKKYDPNAKVLTTDLYPELSAACNASDGFFKVPRVTHPDYSTELLVLCKQEHVKLVIPTIDTELLVLAQNKERFLAEGIQLLVSDTEFITVCRDKRLTNNFFVERAIEIPQIVNKNKPTFPLFIKPYDGSLSSDTFLIERAEQLTAYHLSNPKLLFMEYIDQKDYDEFTVDMYYGKDHNVKCIVPRQRLAVRGGEISKGITLKNEIVDFLKSKLYHIPGAIGCQTLQLFRHKTTARKVAIEINARFGGGFPLSYLAGANYPKWLMKEYFFKEELQYTDQWEENLLMLRYDQELLVHDFKTE